MLLDSELQIVAIPDDKVLKAKILIEGILSKKKVTVHKMQSLCGFLNFLGRSVIPGRSFTRQLYAAYSGDSKLKQHHHIRINKEMRMDLSTWLTFLSHPSVFSRKFIDFTQRSAMDISFYTDASKTIGIGGFCKQERMHAKWNKHFIAEQNPSISYLELFAVTAGLLNWMHKFKNMCIILHCDNQGAVDMINTSSSKCRQCMKLIRLIVLNCMIHNVKVTARHVRGIHNELSDLLSRDKIMEFRNLANARNL